MTGLLLGLGILMVAWTWLRKEYPTATGTATTLAKGTWAVTKGTVKLTHRGIVAASDLYAATREQVQCPHCKTTFPTIGVVTCTCGYPERRRFAAPCGHCGSTGPGFWKCPACHLGVRYPLAWLKPKGSYVGGASARPRRAGRGKRTS